MTQESLGLPRRSRNQPGDAKEKGRNPVEKKVPALLKNPPHKRGRTADKKSSNIIEEEPIGEKAFYAIPCTGSD